MWHVQCLPATKSLIYLWEILVFGSVLFGYPSPGDILMKIKSWCFSRNLYKKPFQLNNLRRRWREDSLKLSTWNERNIWEPCNVCGYVCQKVMSAKKSPMFENQKIYLIFGFCSTTFSSQTKVSQFILCKTTKLQMASFHWAI